MRDKPFASMAGKLPRPIISPKTSAPSPAVPVASPEVPAASVVKEEEVKEEEENEEPEIEEPAERTRGGAVAAPPAPPMPTKDKDKDKDKDKGKDKDKDKHKDKDKDKDLVQEDLVQEDLDLDPLVVQSNAIECICCARKPPRPPGVMVDNQMIIPKQIWSRCCCLLYPSKRAIEVFLLVFLVGNAAGCYTFSIFTFFNVAVAQNVLAQPFLVLATAYAIILLTSATYNRKMENPKSRMTNVCTALTIACIICYIAPLLANYQLVKDLPANLHAAFPNTINTTISPIAPSPAPFSTISWLKFYAHLRLTLTGATSSVSTYSEVPYKTVLDREIRDCPSVTRPWKEELLMDVYRPTTLPPSLTKSPVIFHIHGGAWKLGDKSQTAWEFGYFLERGYTIVSSQYSFACYGYTGQDMHGDLTDAYAYLGTRADEWNVDMDRVTVVGESAGGHLATWLGYTLKKDDGSNAFNAVFNCYGPGNFELWATLGNQWHGKPGDLDWPCTDDEFGTGRTSTLYLLTNGECTAESYRAMSATNYITASSPPTITIHGTRDSLVPVVLSDDLHDKLDEAGVENLLIKVAGGEHVLDYGYAGLPNQLLRYSFERLLAGGMEEKGAYMGGGMDGILGWTGGWAALVIWYTALHVQFKETKKRGESSNVEEGNHMEMQIV